MYRSECWGNFNKGMVVNINSETILVIFSKVLEYAISALKK